MTTGATLIIVMLLTLLMLAVVLVASLRLGLTSRQNTGDQKAILKAQYTAESRIALGQSKLRDIQKVLSRRGLDSLGATVPYLGLATGTSKATLAGYAVNFCGKSVNPWVAAPEFDVARDANDSATYAEAMQCKVDGTSNLSNAFNILINSVKPAAFNSLPSGERPAGVTTNEWWASLFTKSSGDYQYEIKPKRSVKLTDSRYRFYFSTLSVRGKSDVSGSQRFIASTGTNRSDWWIEFYVPNPFDFVVFDNYISGGFQYNEFDGDYFTNFRVGFLDAANVKFKGHMYSAGCNNYNTTTFSYALNTNDPPDCLNKTPGFRTGASGGNLGNLVTNTSSQTTSSQINTYLNTKIDPLTTFSTGKKGYFTEQYIKLPLTSQAQLDAATDAGLIAVSTPGSDTANIETDVVLSVGNGSGASLAFADGKWNENISGGAYQYITFKNAGGAVKREYRYGPDLVLYKKISGTWQKQTKTVAGVTSDHKFNGVIYSGKTSEPSLKISGPARLSTSYSGTIPPLNSMPPALASFSKMNITAANGFSVDTDLTMSNPPCDNASTLSGSCTNNPDNALLLYAAAGNVQIATTAPKDVTLYSAIMASKGGLGVDGYNTITGKGKLNIIGSVVEDGPKLKYSGSNGRAPVYSYDKRMRDPDLFPASPIVNVWYIKDAEGSKDLSEIVFSQGKSGNF
ncbi:hypothetical protein D3875_15875 [Deinococcus cavernae]|uniref:DUF4900 domain-containing protein n=1 Tax=Deinococcus cavernae TaxID=2320857 RepID=A0A418V9N4_9DEIO|nr:hypothetical protein D3875_15875 [Deinococcus cavernae]